jgi:hypothetical protein
VKLIVNLNGKFNGKSLVKSLRKSLRSMSFKKRDIIPGKRVCPLLKIYAPGGKYM